MQKSECGRYKWDHPFVKIGKESDRIFQMARGNTAPGEDIVHLGTLPLRTKAATGHTVRGLMNNLGSMSTMTRNGYIPIFEGDKISIYNAGNTPITVSRTAVLEGWYVPHKKLWRIPLVKNVTDIRHQTATVKKSPARLLQDGPPPPTDKAFSAYKLKTKPELICYFHAAAGFPIKPTWVKAIKNGHYKL